MWKNCVLSLWVAQIAQHWYGSPEDLGLIPGLGVSFSHIYILLSQVWRLNEIPHIQLWWMGGLHRPAQIAKRFSLGGHVILRDYVTPVRGRARCTAGCTAKGIYTRTLRQIHGHSNLK